MSTFTAYRIFEENGKSTGRFVQLTLDDLDAGEVVIKVHYSGINYKDALAATGAGKVIKRFPCVGGVDASGIVESSQDARFKAGDAVIVTGYGLGIDHDGGYAEYMRVPADWVVPLPQAMSLSEAMVLGTAGFTAALAIHRMEQNELRPENGKVIVTGATGGVSSMAIQMLSQQGYHVVALTGKDSEHDYLKMLGATEVLSRKELQMGKRPLEKALWAGAVDSVGGETLSWLTRTMQQRGVIACFGNAGGLELHTSLIPFILRGVRLIGLDAASTVMSLRQQFWPRMAAPTGNPGSLRPRLLDKIANTIEFAQLPEACEKMIAAQSRGRYLIRIKAE